MFKKKKIKEFNKYIQDSLQVFKGLGDNLAFIQGQHDFHLSYLSYQLLKHSKSLGILTIILIILTFVLSVLTAWNIWLLIH
jgi:hypothetical protein